MGFYSLHYPPLSIVIDSWAPLSSNFHCFPQHVPLFALSSTFHLYLHWGSIVPHFLLLSTVGPILYIVLQLPLLSTVGFYCFHCSPCSIIHSRALLFTLSFIFHCYTPWKLILCIVLNFPLLSTYCLHNCLLSIVLHSGVPLFALFSTLHWYPQWGSIVCSVLHFALLSTVGSIICSVLHFALLSTVGFHCLLCSSLCIVIQWGSIIVCIVIHFHNLQYPLLPSVREKTR